VKRFPAAAVRRFTASVFEHAGLPAPDAQLVAERMVDADVSGADGHGIIRVPQYVRRLKAGGYNPRPNIQVQLSGESTALVDGDNGMGHLVMTRAANTAIELAARTGASWVGIRNSNHAGPGAVYATMPLAHDMIGIYCAVASANHMAPWGGRERLLGTNPIAFAIPAGEEPPVVLDMATSIVSFGTVKKYAVQGKSMPADWILDDNGQPITDATKAGHGLLLPAGGYKGSGLAIVLGLLAGALNGALFGGDVIDFNADDVSVTNTGHAMCALEVRRFMPPEQFKKLVDGHIREIRESERLPGVEAIYVPGEQRQARIRERTAHGIPIPDNLVAQLNELAEDLGAELLAQV